MNREQLIQNLRCPRHPVDVVIDTDAFNEVDDQFALAYLLKNQHRLRLRAIYAAPFVNDHAATAQEGVSKSYDEVLNILSLAGENALRDRVFPGAGSFLHDRDTPVRCPAVEDLIRQGMAHTPEEPLYVIGIASATDIASALLLEPALAQRLVVIWLGGSAYHCAGLEEFNLIEDLPAAQVLFASGVPLIQVPCWGMAEHFTISKPELERYLLPGDPLCRYLASHMIQVVDDWYPDLMWADPIWDVTAVAWLLDPEGRFFSSETVPTPVPLRLGYDFSQKGQPMGYVNRVHRDALMTDLLRTLTKGGSA